MISPATADGTGIANLSEIGDVTITTPSDGDALTYQSGIWLNQAGGGATPAGSDGHIQFNDGGSALGASSNLFWDAANNRLGINDSAPAVALDVQGNINYTGVLVDVSDRRQKENIRNLTGALDKLRYVEGVSFTMKNDPERKVELGLIAQDVEQVYPFLVQTDPQGVKSLNYTGMIGPLVEAVKELDAQNTALADENAELRKMIRDLSVRMDVLEGKRRPKYRPYND